MLPLPFFHDRFVCNYNYEQKMKREYSLSGGKVPEAEPYQTADEDGNPVADWEPAPGKPSMYGGSRGEFLKHCWGALLRAAASTLTLPGGTANIYESAKDIRWEHTVSGTAEEATKCQEALSECYYVPFDSPSLFFRCVPNKKVDEASEEECIEGITVDGEQRKDVDGGCLKKLVTKTVKTEEATEENVLMDKFQTFSATAGRYMGDLNRTFYVILIFGGIAIVMGFVWLQLLKRFAGYFVWLTIGLLQASLLFVTLYCWHKAGKFSSPELDALAAKVDEGVSGLQVNDPDADPRATAEEDDQKAFEVYAIICTVVTSVYFVMILLAYKKVKIAVGVIEEASKAVHTMPFIVMWPCITVTCVFIVFGIWATGAAIIGTAGSIATEDRSGALASLAARRALLEAHAHNDATQGYLPVEWSVGPETPSGTFEHRRLDDGDGDGGSTVPVVYAKFNADGTFNATAAGLGAAAYKIVENMSGQDVLQVYNLFTFLWTNQFFQGIETMTIAGAIACWYWTLDKSDRKNLAKHPISSSLYRAVRYHLGTICFGSLIIAIVQLVRIALAYLDRQTKGLQKANFAVKMLMKCAQCCLWCFEKCVKFITNSAYIVCAMYGGGFCRSTKKAFKLILKNAARVATLKMISTFLMILGKVVIAATCGFLGFLWIDNDPQYQPPPDGDGEALSSVLLPVIVCTFVAFMVGSAFIGVYSMAIDTIMLCFLEDMAINDGTKDKPYYADGKLKKFVEAHSDKPKRRRKKKKKGKSKRHGKSKTAKGGKKDDKAGADAKAGDAK